MNDGVVESIYTQMVEYISNGVWSAGTKIPTENELAEAFHASRSSIRQAISRLKALGLIESKRGSGTIIKKSRASTTLSDIIPAIMFEVNDNIQIFEFHKGIQIECAKLACMRYTDEQMALLIEHTRQMKTQYAQKNMEQAIFHDLEYHKTVCEMSGNLMFVRATEIIYQRLAQAFIQISSSFEYTESIVFHERLIAALKDRNPSFAAAIMEGHQWDTYQKFLALPRTARTLTNV
ncbi:MAG: FadR/GntR family transcriptional regulator [Lachnospiraceae bacterium]